MPFHRENGGPILFTPFTDRVLRKRIEDLHDGRMRAECVCCDPPLVQPREERGPELLSTCDEHARERKLVM